MNWIFVYTTVLISMCTVRLMLVPHRTSDVSVAASMLAVAVATDATVNIAASTNSIKLPLNPHSVRWLRQIHVSQSTFYPSTNVYTYTEWNEHSLNSNRQILHFPHKWISSSIDQFSTDFSLFFAVHFSAFASVFFLLQFVISICFATICSTKTFNDTSSH